MDQTHQPFQIALAVIRILAPAEAFQRAVQLVQRVEYVIGAPVGEKRGRADAFLCRGLVQDILDGGEFLVEAQFAAAVGRGILRLGQGGGGGGDADIAFGGRGGLHL